MQALRWWEALLFPVIVPMGPLTDSMRKMLRFQSSQSQDIKNRKNSRLQTLTLMQAQILDPLTPSVWLKLRWMKINQSRLKSKKHHLQQIRLIFRLETVAIPLSCLSIKGFRLSCRHWNYTPVSTSTKTALKGKNATWSKLANSLMNIRRSGKGQLISLVSFGKAPEAPSTHLWWSSKLWFALGSSVSRPLSLRLSTWLQ